MKLNESLFEDRENYDIFFGTVELEFPESENVTTRDIEKMIKENISKHTEGNVIEVKFTTGEEVDSLKSKLKEDWHNGEFTDEDFKDYENDIFNKFLALVLSVETVAKNHPEYKNKCAHLLKEIAYSANAHGDEIDNTNESLKESVEEVSNGAPEAGEDTGVTSILNSLVKDEYDAIEEYNSAIATIASRDSDYSEIINVLTDIVGEEQVHVGQLTEAMKIVSPNVEKQEEGKQEAQKQINEPVKSEIVEESLDEDFNYRYFARFVNNDTGEVMEQEGKNKKSLLYSILDNILYDSTPENLKNARLTIEDTHTGREEYYNPLDYIKNYELTGMNDLNNIINTFEQNEYKSRDCRGSMEEYGKVDGKYAIYGNISIKGDLGKEEIKKKISNLANVDKEKIFVENIVYDEEIEETMADFIINTDISYTTNFEKIANEDEIDEDLDSTSTATDIVRELYNKFPKLDFIDERDMKNDKVALFFRFGKDLDLGKLEDYLKERNINYIIKNGKMRIIADEDEMNEDFVHYKPDGEHLNFNPIVLGSSLELGDEVYDNKTGHKLKVASEPVDFRWSRRITFLDLDTNEHKTQEVGINSMWTTVVEGDTTEEVDDDFDIKWHPASDLIEAKRDLPGKEKDLMKYAESQIEDDNDKIWEYLNSSATYVDDVKDIPNKTKDGQPIKYRFSSGKDMNINVYKDPYEKEIYILVDKKNKSINETYYPDNHDEELEHAWYMDYLDADRDGELPYKYMFNNAKEARRGAKIARDFGYLDSWSEGAFVYIAGKKNESLTEDKEEKESKRAKLMSHI